MNVTFEKLDDLHGQLTVAVEEQDYASKVEKQLKQIGKNHAEPGFRPGHVPAGIIRKKYGEAVKYDEINKLVGDAVYNYIKENKLPVLGQPLPAEGNRIDPKSADFTLTFRLGLAPEIADPANADLHVPYYEIEVTDEMVTSQVEQLRERCARQIPGDVTEPNALVKGVITELDAEGKPLEGGIVVENGILAPMYFKNDDQKKLFEEKHPGDVVVFNPYATCEGNPAELSSMLNIDKSDVEAHKGDFTMEIKEIIVARPAEMNQEFFDTVLGKDKAHNEEELRAAVRDMMAQGMVNDANARFTIDAKEAIMAKEGNMQLPDDLLKEFLIQQNEGLNKDNIDEEYAKMHPSIIWDVVREKIASDLAVSLTEDDMMGVARSAVMRQMVQYGITNMDQEMVDRYASDILKDKKSADYVRETAFANKLFDAIRNNVTLDNKKVSVDEFRALYEVKENAAPAAE